MRSAKVLYKNKEAGVLAQQDDGTFVFHYHPQWVEDASKPPISLTLQAYLGRLKKPGRS